MKTVAATIWYGNSGTPPPPPLVLEVVVEMVVEMVEVVVEVVELGAEVEVLVVVFSVVDEVVAPLVEEPYSRTLPSPQSATQRLPLESNAIPVG